MRPVSRRRFLQFGVVGGAGLLLGVRVGIAAAATGEDASAQIGRSRHDVDLRSIVTGAPLYGLDLQLPGLLYAAIRRSPVSDGQVATFDDAKARALPGVRDVRLLSNAAHDGRVILPNSPNFVSGVAVLADDSWTALQGARALEVHWQLPEKCEGTDELYRRCHAALDGDATVVRRDGEPECAIGAAQEPFEAVYQVPLLAHAPMEPMNCTARVADGRVEIWAPTQNPGGLAEAVARVLAVDAAAIRLHVLRSGGAFGRRYYSDFAIEAAPLAPAVCNALFAATGQRVRRLPLNAEFEV